MVPAQPPLPTDWSLPFHFASGSQISILIWESLEAIKAVAGPNYTVAIVPEDRLKYLLRHDSHSAHYEIKSIQGLIGLS